MCNKLLEKLRPPTRPGRIPPPNLKISSEALTLMWDHVRQEAPRVASGILAGSGGRVAFVRPLRNAFHSERALQEFLRDPNDQNAALQELNDRQMEIMGVYFSSDEDSAVPSPKISSTWQASPEVLYVTVPITEIGLPRAFVISEDCVREVPVKFDGIEPVLETIRRQFKVNVCLSLYTWTEAFNRFLQEHDWQGAHQLVNETENGTYLLWSSAKQAIEAKKQVLVRHESGQASPDDVGEDGSTFLAQMLQETSRKVRREAALAMGQLRNARALQTALWHSDVLIQMLAAGALRRCGSYALPAFRTALNHSHWFVRKQAVEHLAIFGNGTDLPAIIAALNDPDVDVCEAAIRAVQQRHDRSALSNLQALLHTSIRDSNGQLIRKAVRDALLSFGEAPPPDFPDDDIV